MTLSETVGEEIISVAICGGSFHSLPGLRTEQNRTERNGTERNRAKQNRTEQIRTDKNR